MVFNQTYFSEIKIYFHFTLTYNFECLNMYTVEKNKQEITIKGNFQGIKNMPKSVRADKKEVHKGG